jgi:hypothetical protein
MRRLPFLVVIVLLYAISTSTTTTTTLCHAAAAADEMMIVSLTRSDSLTVRKQTTSFFSFFSSSDTRHERFSQVKITSSFAFLSDQKTQGKNNTHTLSLAFSSLFEKIKKERENEPGRSETPHRIFFFFFFLSSTTVFVLSFSDSLCEQQQHVREDVAARRSVT